MRDTRWSSARLLAISMSGMVLLFVFCNSVWTQETKKSSPRVKELQQQRLAVLEEICDGANRLYRNARIEFEDVHAAERELFVARITHAETQKDRINACDEAIKHATEWHQIAQARKESARGTQIPVLKSQAFMLEVQIARENAVTDE